VNAGVDVDGNRPEVGDVPELALIAFDTAIQAFNRHLPGWYEQGDDILPSKHPWLREALRDAGFELEEQS
jgi:hypothetical protein